MIRTKGDVIVEEIKVGDNHYEFEYGVGIEVEVISLPVIETNESGERQATWQSKNIRNGKIINYMVNEKYSHYGPNIYTYKAYEVNHWI